MDVQGSLWLPLWIRFIVRRDWGGWLDRRMTGWAGNWIGRPNCSHNKLRKRAKERGEERVTADGWVSSPTSSHPSTTATPPPPPLLSVCPSHCGLHLTVKSPTQHNNREREADGGNGGEWHISIWSTAEKHRKGKEERVLACVVPFSASVCVQEDVMLRLVDRISVSVWVEDGRWEQPCANCRIKLDSTWERSRQVGSWD